MRTGPSGRRLPRAVGVFVELILALAITGALLTVVEAGAGWFTRRWSHDDQVSAAVTHAEGDVVETTLVKLPDNPVPLVSNRELLWRNEPGARRDVQTNPRAIGRPDSWRVAINRDGFRGPERASGATPGPIYRILCVGDSITYGWGADQDDAFPRRLEAILREAHPDAAIEVINAGVPGWTWIQGLRYLEREGLALHPDVVVMGHGTNDQFADTRSTDVENLGGSTLWSQAIFRAINLLGDTNAFRALELLRGRQAGSRRPSRACRRQMAETGVCHRVSLAEIEAAVREVSRLTSREGIDLLLVNLDFMRTLAVEGTRAAAQAEHLRLVDFVERFDALRVARENARSARLGLIEAQKTPRPPDADPGSRRMLLRVHLRGPAAAVTVQGKAYALDTVTFDEPMFDDGTHGDETAGDGVYSTTIELPARLQATAYTFARDGETEFTPLPPFPSQMGVRLRMGTDNVIAPVEEFGELYLMTEQAHPDREGYAVIATTLAAEIDQLPSFTRFLDRLGHANRADVGHGGD